MLGSDEWLRAIAANPDAFKKEVRYVVTMAWVGQVGLGAVEFYFLWWLFGLWIAIPLTVLSTIVQVKLAVRYCQSPD